MNTCDCVFLVFFLSMKMAQTCAPNAATLCQYFKQLAFLSLSKNCFIAPHLCWQRKKLVCLQKLGGVKKSQPEMSPWFRNAYHLEITLFPAAHICFQSQSSKLAECYFFLPPPNAQCVEPLRNLEIKNLSEMTTSATILLNLNCFR